MMHKYLHFILTQTYNYTSKFTNIFISLLMTTRKLPLDFLLINYNQKAHFTSSSFFKAKQIFIHTYKAI